MIKHRYDVYLESGIPENDASLILMRFPGVRSQLDRPADQIQMSIRPKSQEMKLSIILDSNAPTFCQRQANALGQKSDTKTFNGIVNKNIYTSTRTKIEGEQLYACKLEGDRLICRPVSDLLILRSDLSHFDVKEEMTDVKEEVRPVSVKFAAPERHNPTARNRTDETEDPLDEPKTLSFANLNSRDSNLQRLALFAPIKPDPDRVSNLKMDPESMPEIKPDPDKEPHIKTEPGSQPDIKPKITQAPLSPRKSIAIKQGVKDCLLRTKLVSFEEVHDFVGQPEQLKDILDALADMAVLVQGNWAVKSEVLYGDSSERDSTDVTGISIKLFIAARDYLLWLFNQTRLVSRLEFSQKVSIPDYDVLELINQVAMFKDDVKKWELKLPTDQRFMEKFPEVVQRQTKLWMVRKANKLSIFG